MSLEEVILEAIESVNVPRLFVNGISEPDSSLLCNPRRKLFDETSDERSGDDDNRRRKSRNDLLTVNEAGT